MIPTHKFVRSTYEMVELMGIKYFAGDYMTKSIGSPGAGDILNIFLGPVILSFAFSIYRQRKVDTGWNYHR